MDALRRARAFPIYPTRNPISYAICATFGHSSVVVFGQARSFFPVSEPLNSTNTLNAALLNLNISRAEKYSPRAFRRGAANELKTRGAQWPTIVNLGESRPLVFRGYLDLTLELDRDMYRLLAEMDRISADEAAAVRTLGAESYLKAGHSGVMIPQI